MKPQGKIQLNRGMLTKNSKKNQQIRSKGVQTLPTEGNYEGSMSPRNDSIMKQVKSQDKLRRKPKLVCVDLRNLRKGSNLEEKSRRSQSKEYLKDKDLFFKNIRAVSTKSSEFKTPSNQSINTFAKPRPPIMDTACSSYSSNVKSLLESKIKQARKQSVLTSPSPLTSEPPSFTNILARTAFNSPTTSNNPFQAISPQINAFTTENTQQKRQHAHNPMHTFGAEEVDEHFGQFSKRIQDIIAGVEC